MAGMLGYSDKEIELALSDLGTTKKELLALDSTLALKAFQKRIAKNYRRAVGKLHPDVVGEEGTRRLATLNDVHATLSALTRPPKPDKRQPRAQPASRTTYATSARPQWATVLDPTNGMKPIENHRSAQYGTPWVCDNGVWRQPSW